VDLLDLSSVLWIDRLQSKDSVLIVLECSMHRLESAVHALEADTSMQFSINVRLLVEILGH